jgi:hypothetical protein
MMESSAFRWFSILSCNSTAHRTARALDYAHPESVREAVKVQVQKYLRMNEHLLKEDGETSISVAVRPNIRRLTLEEKRTLKASGMNFHQMPQCGSCKIPQHDHADLDMSPRIQWSPRPWALNKLIHVVNRHINFVPLNTDENMAGWLMNSSPSSERCASCSLC